MEEEAIGALEESPISFQVGGQNEGLSRKDQSDDEQANSEDQCWGKFITPTVNFPTTYDPNRKFKNLIGDFPTSDKFNWNMLLF